jgi:choline dehydrogenase-like flavoprotein
VGRHLMRHSNAVVMGVFPRRPDREREFHKQIGIHDFYFGDSAGPSGKLGALQQLATPPPALVKAHLSGALGSVVAKGVPHVTGLLVIAEDQPQADNRVEIDRRTTDRFGLPQLLVTHRYSRRDDAAGLALVTRARELLHRAGAWVTCVQPIRTFSHAVGTLRMGTDPTSSALDPHGRFRGLDNVYVADASAFPTSAAVNPSLTIAAHALRLGAHLTGRVEVAPVTIARAS